MSSSHPETSMAALKLSLNRLYWRVEAAAGLTGHPVVIQFAFEVVVRAERLQRELELLPVERLSHAQLLHVKHT